jgi:thymidylate synthase
LRANRIHRRAWGILRRPPTIFDYRYEDFDIIGYQSHPHIKAPVAV